LHTFTKMTEEKALTEEIEVIEGANASLNGTSLTVSGPKGNVVREFNSPKARIKLEGRQITLSASGNTRKDKTVLKTYKAHIRNAMKGVTEGYVYKLKVCSGHFPITVSVSGNRLEIKNFLGEKIPRKVNLMPGAAVKVDGSTITVESPDIEKAGQVAADIEQATRRPGFDRRIFQDGIYIIEKEGEQI